MIGDNDCDGGMDATGVIGVCGMRIGGCGCCDDVIGAGDGERDAIGGCDDDGDGDAVQ